MQINYESCKKLYIGQTTLSITTRFKECKASLKDDTRKQSDKMIQTFYLNYNFLSILNYCRNYTTLLSALYCIQHMSHIVYFIFSVF